jgi:hypothetical protein
MNPTTRCDSYLTVGTGNEYVQVGRKGIINIPKNNPNLGIMEIALLQMYWKTLLTGVHGLGHKIETTMYQAIAMTDRKGHLKYKYESLKLTCFLLFF